ncbi:MAG: N-glycosylase/DNA lyase [archaeon]|nr:N-glycosylase/DNA lyase [archaeon]MCR4323691.1 N-glycosylase/DNA lyase [Nanoarchaeota archaeon]
MEKLVKKINELKNSEISKVISERIREFENVKDLFHELCFCLMTANFKAEKSIEIQKEIGRGFYELSQEDLATELKRMGHRFWPQRAERIVLARELKEDLSDLKEKDSSSAREWLVKNVKGLGMKEASHFLRNIGKRDVAIIDFHIMDLLEKENIIKRPKSLSPRAYLEIEKQLSSLATELKLNLAELDLYLWYIETGKVLK